MMLKNTLTPLQTAYVDLNYSHLTCKFAKWRGYHSAIAHYTCIVIVEGRTELLVVERGGCYEHGHFS